MSDRKMIKWLPFNSVISSKEVLSSILKEKQKISKPSLSEDEKMQIESTLIDAFYLEEEVIITYYKNGYTYKYKGIIKKIDSLNKLIYLTNFNIFFNQIIKVVIN